MDLNLTPVLVVQGGGLLMTIGAIVTMSKVNDRRIGTLEKDNKTTLGHEARIVKIEKYVDEMPEKYVPRSEVQLMLSGISKTTDDTKALIQALVYGGGDRAVARKALEPKK